MLSRSLATMLRTATRRGLAATIKKAGKPRAHPKPWSEAGATFRKTFKDCQEIGRGCKWCTQGSCCTDIEANQRRLKIWRDQMRSVSSSRRDAEVLLIFGSSSRERSESVEPESSTKPNIKPTEDDEMSDATQLTSVSSESDGAQGTGGTQQNLRPSLKRKLKQAQSVSEAESQVTTMSTQSSQSTSSDPPSHQPVRQKQRGPPRVMNSSRGLKQIRLGKASSSIDLANLIFPSGTPKVCRRSALHFLSLSEQRVRRLCDGLVDGRTRGHRLPNSHPAFAPQLFTCHRFLTHCWHFFAEGLPDKFSIAKGDGCSKRLTLGASASPRPTRLELETDTEDSGEEDERSISALALHIHSAEEAGTMALNGPLTGTAGGRAPCRYIGVIRPVALFAMLGEWCAARSQPCPGFSTLLRALVDAKPYIKFRKCAGQHANCEVCVEFKKALKKLLSVQKRQELLEAYSRIVSFLNREERYVWLPPPSTLPAT